MIDAADPAAPQEVAYLALAPVPRSIALVDSHAYMAAGSGLHVVDLQQPAAPRLARTLEMVADACAAEAG